MRALHVTVNTGILTGNAARLLIAVISHI